MAPLAGAGAWAGAWVDGRGAGLAGAYATGGSRSATSLAACLGAGYGRTGTGAGPWAMAAGGAAGAAMTGPGGSMVCVGGKAAAGALVKSRLPDCALSQVAAGRRAGSLSSAADTSGSRAAGTPSRSGCPETMRKKICS